MKDRRIKVRRLCVLILIVSLIFVVHLAFASTEVGGNISEDTTWTKANSPYIVTSTVQVLEGVKLIIGPGVNIKFSQNTGLNIGGQLRAIGTTDQYILFTSNQSSPAPGDWCGITFVDSSIDAQYDLNKIFFAGNIIKYATIEFAGRHCSSQAAAAITCLSSSPFISNNIISHNSGFSTAGGLYLRNCENIRIYNNEIVNNSSRGQGGAFWILDTSGEIKHNIIKNNNSPKGGAFYIAYKSPLIKNNIIENNNATSIGGGFYIRDLYNPIEISGNNLINNTPYSISLDPQYSSSKKDIYAFNNYWGTTDLTAVSKLIYDYYDNLELARVVFKPIVHQPYNFSGGTISGIVKDGSTGKIVSATNITTDIGVQTTTDELGMYLLENIAQGAYTITATAPLYYSSTVEGISVSAGETTNLNISLVPKTTGIISGHVLSSEGLTAIANITVELSNEADNLSVSSDVDGSFSFHAITHGDYTIRIISDLYWGTPQNIAVNINKTTQVTLVSISQSIIDDIRNGWYTHEQIDQAVADAEASKNVIIAEKNQVISDLNTKIASMFTHEQLDQAVLNEKQRWDINRDNKIGLEEAIRALKIVSGIK